MEEATVENSIVTLNSLKNYKEGPLLKFANVVKGYQHRYFVLNPECSTLEYFEKAEHKVNKPRGALSLAFASVCPSVEDSQTFVVQSTNGEAYRLRAPDAKQRQEWVDKIRSVAHFQQNHSASAISIADNASEYRTSGIMTNINPNVAPYQSFKQNSLAEIEIDPFREVREVLTQLSKEQDDYDRLVALLPKANASVTYLDCDILLFRALSRANLATLRASLQALETMKANSADSHCSTHTSHVLFPLNDNENTSTAKEEKSLDLEYGSIPANIVPVPDMPIQAIPMDHSLDVQDEEDYNEQDLGSVEEHKSVILHLISQLKLGMDLTKVVLPTFILEKRSLLEMFADCMAHPHIFLRITDLPNPESRIIGVVEWFITSFHAGRKGSLAKKPYNPIIGETFHCSWQVNEEDLKKVASSSVEPNTSVDNNVQEHVLTYCSEQVSHHPPVTAFYFECPTKRMYLNASVYTKSKFQGISICAAMIGKLSLHLLDHNEEYQLSLPSVYARSILTVPWVELGDKIHVQCAQTKYSASITFHTKPFYGGKLHRVSAEVKSPEGIIVSKIQGEWNGMLEFDLPNRNEKYCYNVSELKQFHKRVRPEQLQGNHESRRLWRNVTAALKQGDLTKASKYKHELEQRQRDCEKWHKEHELPFPVKYFKQLHDNRAGNGFESWLYHQCLKGELDPNSV